MSDKKEENKSLDSPNVTSVKMYDNPLTYTTTPKKTFEKKTELSAKISSPQQSPVEKTDLESVRQNLEKFCDQLETQMRATMSSIMSEEMKEAKATLESMRQVVKDFQGHNRVIIFEASLKFKALKQKVAFLQKYNTQLSKDKAQLSARVAQLEQAAA
ncbi:hypothetical protein ACF0H5_003297 [Mactra antiquata]